MVQCIITLYALLICLKLMCFQGPAIFNGLINYLVKDRSLRKQKLPLFFETIIDNSRKLCNWWETESSTNTDSKLAIVTLLQKILSAQPKVWMHSGNSP